MNAEPHASWEDLIESLARPEGQTSDLRDHLASCSRCRKEYLAVKKLIETLSEARLPHPPNSLVDRTLDLVTNPGRDLSALGQAGLRGILDTIGNALSRLSASLVADSMTPSPAVRGTAAGAPRLLLYQTETHSISVSLLETNENAGHRIVGQVSHRSDSVPGEEGLVFLQGSDTVYQTSVSPQGEFEFESVDQGPYEISIPIGDHLIIVGPFKDVAS